MRANLDHIDRNIIRLLQEDAKLTIKEIASRLNMTNTPIYERIKKLENEGIIERYTAVINKEKVGLNLIAYCSVSLEHHSKTYIEQFMANINELDEVIECYHIAGMFDYLLKIICKDMNDYHQFITNKLSSIPNLGKVQSSFVMSEIKNKLDYQL